MRISFFYVNIRINTHEKLSSVMKITLLKYDFRYGIPPKGFEVVGSSKASEGFTS